MATVLPFRASPAWTRVRASAAVVAGAVVVALGTYANAGLAQSKGGRKARVHRSPGDAGAPSSRSAVTVTASMPLAVPGGPSGDAGVVESKVLDGGTRVFKFKELDIEGHLKSPQLVYFLRRVRAEFGAQDLGHRSFLREMSETRKESTF
jgi:hypothetical protein